MVARGGLSLTPPYRQFDENGWALTRRLLRRGDFASREDLEAQITAYTVDCNRTARPYRWRYDADAERARYLDHHPQPAPDTFTQAA